MCTCVHMCTYPCVHVGVHVCMCACKNIIYLIQALTTGLVGPEGRNVVVLLTPELIPTPRQSLFGPLCLELPYLASLPKQAIPSLLGRGSHGAHQVFPLNFTNSLREGPPLLPTRTPPPSELHKQTSRVHLDSTYSL